MRIAAVIVIAILGVNAAPDLSAAESTEVQHALNIPPGDLATALNALARQSGADLVYRPEQVQGMATRGAKGNFTVQEAIRRLLQGTRLKLTIAPTGSMLIAAPVRGNEPAAAIGDSSSELEEVVVTGSNIRRPGASIDRGPIPIETVSAEEFRAASGESIASFLQSRPVFTGNNGTPANDYYGGGEYALNLRGLGTQYTLVLINGRRAAGEDGIADVGAIPDEAIDSVEILKSGSSAIYGANAVGGVVNIKLKRNFEGVKAATSYGNTTNHDASYRRVAMLFGTGAERWRVVGSFAWQDRNGIEPGDRRLTATADWRPYGGQDGRSPYFYAPQFIDLGDGSYYSLDVSRFSVGQIGRAATDYLADPIEQSFNRFDTGHLPANSRRGGHWATEFDLLDQGRATLFSEGYYDQRRQLFHPLGLPIIGGAGFSALIVPADNPFNPFGREVAANYFVGRNEYPYRVENRFKTATLLATGGVQGNVARWSYEVAYSHYKQKVRDTWRNDFDSALAQAAVDDGTLNVFGYWANPPALIDSLVAPPRSSMRQNSADTISAKLSGTLFDLPAGPLQFAVGMEHRELRYGESNDIPKQTIATFWSDARNDAGRFARDVTAYFGELRVPVYSKPGQLLSSIEVSGAIRRERFNDFGSTNVPQAAVRASLMDDALVLRASYAEGFRPPSLEQLTPFEGLVASSGIYDPYFDDEAEVFTRVGGNPDLVAEVGVTRNIGVVFMPPGMPRLTLHADWWQVKLSDTIQSPYVGSVLLGEQPGTIERDPVTGIATVDTRYMNTGDRVIEGWDFGGYYRTRPRRFGTVTVDFSTSLMTTIEHTFGTLVTDGVGRWTGTFGNMPRYRSVLATTWQFGGWQASLFLHHEPGVKEDSPIARKTDDYSTGDIQLAYEFSADAAQSGLLHGARLYAGVENFWDEDLPFFASTYLGWEGSLHDLRGRYYYLGLSKQF